jgi:hypothetical protein
LKYASDLAKVLQIARFGASSYFIQPAYGSRFETSIHRTILGVDHLDIYLDRIVTALDPTLANLTSLLHDLLSKINGDQHRSAAFGQPSPDYLHLRAISQLFSNHDGWMRLACRTLSFQGSHFQTGD